VPLQIVPDKLLSGRLQANWRAPRVRATYHDLAAHYGTAILLGRVRKPRDTAMVVAGLLVVGNWMLARLRNQPFFLLVALNAAIARPLDDVSALPIPNADLTSANRLSNRTCGHRRGCLSLSMYMHSGPGE
jgi:transposase